MKKVFLLLAAFAATMMVKADLIADYQTFFRAEAINASGTTLERENYATTGDAIKANQWNGTGKANYHSGNDFVVSASDLTYTDSEGNLFVDNAKGLQILFPFTSEFESNTDHQGHDAIYSMTSKQTDYTGKAYYVAFLLKVDSCKSNDGNDIFGFDGNHCANTQRGRIFVKRGPKVNEVAQKTFQIGMAYNSNKGTTPSSEFRWGSTVLVVAKFTPGTASETCTLYVNPILGSNEENNTPVYTETATSSLMKGIKGLTIRKRNNIGCKMAGLRFTDSWADAVKAVEPVSLSLDAAGFTSFSWEHNFTLSEDVDAYKVAWTGADAISLTKVDGIIPANAGVVLYGEANASVEATATAVAATADMTENALVGAPAGTTIATDAAYLLARKDGETAFYLYGGAGYELPARKAYLPAPAVSAPERLEITINEGLQTALQNTSVETKATKVLIDGMMYIRKAGELFTLTGARAK